YEENKKIKKNKRINNGKILLNKCKNKLFKFLCNTSNSKKTLRLGKLDKRKILKFNSHYYTPPEGSPIEINRREKIEFNPNTQKEFNDSLIEMNRLNKEDLLIME
ncbi:hypothetical protein Mgra_00006976, partial [Meloidogyne graminicola]